jgi:hypothetical protein
VRIQGLLAPSLLFALFFAAAVATAFPTRDNSSVVHTQQSKFMAEDPTAPAAAAHPATGPSAKLRAFMQLHGHRLVEEPGYGLSNLLLLALGLVAAVAVFLYRRGRLFDLAPWFILHVFFLAVAARAWHYGFILLALVGLLWINLQDEPAARASGAFNVPLRAAMLLLVLVLAEQCTWSWRALSVDLFQAYSGDQAAAQFLLAQPPGKRIAGFQFQSVGIQPWFPSNPFFNQPGHGFWLWSLNNHVDDRLDETLAARPEIIVIGDSSRPKNHTTSIPAVREYILHYHTPMEDQILATGLYRETHRFLGTDYVGQFTEGLCQVVLERVEH